MERTCTNTCAFPNYVTCPCIRGHISVLVFNFFAGTASNLASGATVRSVLEQDCKWEAPHRVMAFRGIYVGLVTDAKWPEEETWLCDYFVMLAAASSGCASSFPVCIEGITMLFIIAIILCSRANYSSDGNSFFCCRPADNSEERSL